VAINITCACGNRQYSARCNFSDAVFIDFEYASH
jgi:hypothetical protein